MRLPSASIDLVWEALLFQDAEVDSFHGLHLVAMILLELHEKAVGPGQGELALLAMVPEGTEQANDWCRGGGAARRCDQSVVARCVRCAMALW